MRWRGRIQRVLALVRGRRLDRELDAEVEAHLEMAEREARNAGLSAEEARRAARRGFGGIEQMKEEHRDRRSVHWIETAVRDFRIAARTLGRTPGFVAVTVLTLAIGIGATAAVFSLIQGVLLTPPPYRDSEQLVLIPSARTDGQKQESPRPWPAVQWLEWQREAKSVQSIAAYRWMFNFLILPDGVQSFEAMAITPEYFSVVGLEPVLGRKFVASDTTRSAAPVLMIGYELWQRRFGGNPNILGQSVRISRQDAPVEIIGVMPPGVRFLPAPNVAQEPNYDVNALVDMWVPFAPGSDPAELKRPRWNIVGRLAPGFTPEQAQAELALLTERQAQADRDFAGFTPNVQSLTSEYNRDGERILLPLFGAAALVLLIACGNVAALLLLRGLGRQREYAVRAALGVGRAGLFRQASTESLLLALAGGALGAGLAFGAVRAFQLIGGHAIPRLDAVTTGWPVLLFGLGLALIAATLAGLFPAWRASRLDPNEVLKGAGPKSTAGRGERRLLRAVTMAQTALTLVLLVGAGLLIRTMINIANAPSGYDTARILTMSVTSVQMGGADFHRRTLERVQALPGVEHAAYAWGVPLTGNNWPVRAIIEGQPVPASAREATELPLRSITSGYFKMLGLPLIGGRDFRSNDDDHAPPVAIVNQAFADRYFPNTATLGKKVWLRGPDKPPNTIVGVVANGRTDDLTRHAAPEIYGSFWQYSAYSKHLLIRTKAEPLSMASAVQSALRAVNPHAAVEHIQTFDQIREDSLAGRTFAMQLLIGFAAVGCLLTLVGIYGVLSLSVASRRHEIAIRTAVGATRPDIRNLIFFDGFRLIAGGVAAGLVGALVLSRALRSFLYEVEPNDPATLFAVAVLFIGVALLACWPPTRRATRVDPMKTLRCE
ncbi:ABC transporter permease [uncultured Paludibaculum sp.]|uniref:ABC transporter permease n=1 Tax=uncultured Paludibaculum sp. TaxID=1765020 RepID=UPI002AAC4040|nr:ABC transporter permease [uncultured Paludibaculum sp.]